MRLAEQVVTAMRWDTIGSLLASTLTFVTTIWIVRLLGPARFGVLAALLALVGLGQLVTAGGFRHALLRFVPDTVRADGPAAVAPLLARAALGRALILAVVAVPLLVAPAAVARAVLGRPDLAGYVRFIPFLLVLPLYVDALSAALVALFRQRTVRASEVANKLVSAAALALLPLWRDPVIGIFAAWVGGWCVAALWLTVDAVKHGLLRGRATSRVRARRWVAFSGAASALLLLGFVLGRELDVLLLTRLGMPADAVARYAVAFAFASTALSLPMLPIAGGFDVPLIARLWDRRDLDGLRRLYRAFFEYVYIFVTPLVGGGLVLGADLIRVLYGSAYASGGLGAALFVFLGATKIGGVTAPFLMATDRERLLLRIRLAAAALNLGLAVVAIPHFGLLGAALATGVAMAVTVVGEALVLQRFLEPRYPWRFLLGVIASTLVMMAAVGMARLPLGPSPGLVRVLGVTALGTVVYVAMLLLLRPVSPEQVAILARGRAPALAQLVDRVAGGAGAVGVSRP
jgi:O-antigen/teichoic acid export membrane protein